MSDPFLPRVGGVVSADIAVPEHERELRFYSRVLTTGENPLWREDLINNLGMPIIGLGATSPEYAHLPLQWMPHIQVADVAVGLPRIGGQVSTCVFYLSQEPCGSEASRAPQALGSRSKFSSVELDEGLIS